MVVGLAAILFLCGLIADRATPSTVQAYPVQIAPKVMGKVVEVAARDNKRVKPGAS